MRCLLFLACIPSGGAVLSEVYGLASLHDVVWLAAIPCYVLLVAAWALLPRLGMKDVSDALAIGAVAGILATLAYDLARIPFLLSGYRIFAQNSSYGLWILDAPFSTRFTEVVGWIYHFANGICFAIMYALFARGLPWWVAIGWAFLLETIAIVSPYGAIYHITSAPILMVIAYYGHVAYALPLGLMVRHWAWSENALGGSPTPIRIAAAALIGAAIAGPLLSSEAATADSRSRPGLFTIADARMSPSWQRLAAPGEITLRNGCAAEAKVLFDTAPAFTLPPCAERAFKVSKPGIHQIAVATTRFRTRSSFVLVEPVYAP